MLISLDIFDTAIFRDVYEPKDIFRLIGGEEFTRQRVSAEQRCNSLIKYPKLKDIYQFLQGFNMQKEIDLEMNHCFANKTILDMYNNKDNDYIFISDMYLPKEIIAQMLEKCGYENPQVFVSCEFRKSKSTGLFKEVEKVLNRKIDKHYGDNYKADILGAKAANIEPYYLPKIQDRELKLPPVKHSMLKRYLAEIEIMNCTDLKKLALKYAIILTVFTKWVLNKRTDKNTKIFFLSRDMYVPYKIAKEFLNEENVYYLNASRKSLSGIALKSNNKILLDKMNIILSKEKQQEIIENNEYENAVSYLKSMNISKNDFIVDIGYMGTIQKLIELGLNIKLKGLYIQSDPNRFKDLSMMIFSAKRSIQSRALAEIVIGSPENEIIGYKDNKPVFNVDSNIREELSTNLISWIISSVPKVLRIIEKTPITAYDCELILSDVQTNVSQEILEFYNSTIFSDKTDNESPLNFDKELIKQGKLIECYMSSYSKPLFKKMLENDKELAHLGKLLL